MENYINIQGKNIKLTEEQIEQIKASIGGIKLSDIKAGETFKIGTHELVVLEQSGDTTAVILKNLLFVSKRFGDSNNYNGSNVDSICNKWADEIAGIVGAENLVEFNVDLTSDDGLKDYGKVKRKAALLTTEQYRRYVEILDEHNPKMWWWLATPWSTKKHGSSSLVKCVAPSGHFNYYGYYYDCGVRPFCILKSSIFVSC